MGENDEKTIHIVQKKRPIKKKNFINLEKRL